MDSKSIGIAAGALALGTAAYCVLSGKTPMSARPKKSDPLEVKGDFEPGERFKKTLEVQR